VAGPEVLAVRFDRVSLGPGHHILELSCLEPGQLLLDCVTLRRTGERTPSRRRAQARDEGRAFLGIRMGGAESGGVAISDTVAGTAAAAAGIEAGDVLVRIDDEPMDTANRISEAILRHRPGDRVKLALLREGELVERVVTLGRRSESNLQRATAVIEVLDIKPGQVIADIGAGSGWLSEAIAETLGTGGLVYAVEIQESRVRRLRRLPTPNVVPVFSAPDDVSLPANSLDTAMLHDVASHVDRAGRPRFYESVASALKPAGRLVIFGPHGKAKTMLDELREYGFTPLDDLDEADLDERLQNGIVFRYTAPHPD
jgi:SAM-dependent methyltransferase